MITYALAGLTDPRYRYLLGPLTRRRAGIRSVAIVQRDHETQGLPHPAPTFDDFGAMLRHAQPSLVGIAEPAGAYPMIAAALDSGAEVVALPPLAETPAQLNDLAGRIAAGAGVTAVHTWRGHATSAVAMELYQRGKLGVVEGVAVSVTPDVEAEELDQVIHEAVDLCRWLTGMTAASGAITGTVRVPSQPGDQAVASAQHLEAGESLLLEVIGEASDGTSMRLELWRHNVTDDSPGDIPRIAVQVVGSDGAVEWDVATGSFASQIGDRAPVVLSCGRPEREDDWVLAHLVRSREKPLRGVEALLSSQVMMAVRRARALGGARIDW